MRNTDLEYLDFLTREAAALETTGGARVAAVLVYRNKPVAMGYNHKKSNPFCAYFSKNDEAIFFHAETHAIFKALKDVDERILQKATLYIARVKYTPNTRKKIMLWGRSRPCKGCMKCISYYNIPRIVYTEEGNPGENFSIMERDKC
jgi:tRNA(Arg) A34 adenosine deaminase TadA